MPEDGGWVDTGKSSGGGGIAKLVRWELGNTAGENHEQTDGGGVLERHTVCDSTPGNKLGVLGGLTVDGKVRDNAPGVLGGVPACGDAPGNAPGNAPGVRGGAPACSNVPGTLVRGAGRCLPVTDQGCCLSFCESFGHRLLARLGLALLVQVGVQQEWPLLLFQTSQARVCAWITPRCAVVLLAFVALRAVADRRVAVMGRWADPVDGRCCGGIDYR